MGDSTIISCNAPYDEGGLGRLLASVVEEERTRGTLSRYFCIGAKANDPAGHVIDLRAYGFLTRGLMRFTAHGWRDFVACELFDRAVAARLVHSSRIIGVTGRALATFRRARELRTSSLVLEAPNSHVVSLGHQQRLAEKFCGSSRGWLTPLHVRKHLREYAAADEIVVSSEYIRQTFLGAGVPDRKLRRRLQPVSPRFAPPTKRPSSDRFTVVYVGRFDVLKGITVLLDAFGAFRRRDAELVLVGRFASAGMARRITERRMADRRIVVRPGDPLPELHRADVLVHPAFEDGLALAPLEALACGVPVIVTEDTGMKEFVESGRNGFVVPTADVDAIVDRLRWIAEHPMRGTFVPLSLTPPRRESGS